MAERQLGSSVKQRPSQCTRLLVAAIDFGTVYSGYAYSFKAEWPTVMTNKWSGGDLLSYKTPSALLLNPDQSFNSFGFDAEKKYASLTEDGKDCRKYFFFQRFKMILKSSLEKVIPPSCFLFWCIFIINIIVFIDNMKWLHKIEICAQVSLIFSKFFLYKIHALQLPFKYCKNTSFWSP